MLRIAVGYVTIVVICAALITLNPMDFMGRGAREAMLKTEPAASPAVADATAPAAPAAAPQVDAQGDPTIEVMTAAILADLTASANPAVADPAATDTTLAAMSAAAVAGLKGAALPSSDATLAGLVTQALIDGKTDAAIEDLVNQAVVEGLIQAPDALRTAEGRVDTAVLLAAVLARAQAEELGQGDRSEPTDLIDGGTPGLQLASEDLLYAVRPGDSLGALALRFYGDAGLYLDIYKANRQVMDSPEGLRAGMKLLIPAKAGL